MNEEIRYQPPRRRSVWWRSAIYSAIVCFVVGTGMFGLAILLEDREDFEIALTKPLLERFAGTLVKPHYSPLIDELRQNDEKILAELAQTIARSAENHQILIDGEDGETDYFIRLELTSNPIYSIKLTGAEGAVLAEATTRDGFVPPWSDLGQPDWYEVRLPIEDASGAAGYFHLGIQADYMPLMAILTSDYIVVLVIFSLMATLVGLASGLWSGRHIRRRFDNIAAVTGQWADGNLDKRIEDRHSDELSAHSSRLNRMADDLSELVVLRQEFSAHSEREHLSRELHDTVKQQLFALSLQINALKTNPKLPEALANNVVEADETIREINIEIIQLLTQMRPEHTKPVSFVRQLESAQQKYQKYFDVSLQLPSEPPALTPVQQHQTIRIVQEALNNIVKHAKATSTAIRLVSKNKAWSLTIEDNGCGFDPSMEKEGFGLLTMHERAASFGGHVSIRSCLDRGTVIELGWKMKVQTSKVLTDE